VSKVDVENVDGEWFLVLVSRLDYEDPNRLNTIVLTQSTTFNFANIDITIRDENDEPVTIDRIDPPGAESQLIEEFKVIKKNFYKLLISFKQLLGN